MIGGVAWMSFVFREISSFLMLSMPSSSETSLMLLEDGTRSSHEIKAIHNMKIKKYDHCFVRNVLSDP